MLTGLLGLIPLPWRVAGAVALAALLAVGAFAAGVRWEGNARDALELVRSEAARKEEGRLAGIAYDLGMALAAGHAAAEADRAAWVKDRRRVGNAGLVKVDCGAGLRAPAGGAAAVRFGADFVRLFDAGLCVGAAGDCAGGDDAAGAPAGATR